MLIWLLKLVFGILDWALYLLLWIVPLYFILKMVLPGNKYILLIDKYCNGLLIIVRGWLRRFFPKLAATGTDAYIAPVALWLLIRVAKWLLFLLQKILL